MSLQKWQYREEGRKEEQHKPYVLAQDENTAQELLDRAGIKATEIHAPTAWEKPLEDMRGIDRFYRFISGNRIKAGSLLIFTEDMHSYLRKNFSPEEALLVLTGRTTHSTNLRHALEVVVARVDRGEDWLAVLDEQDPIPAWYVSTIRAGTKEAPLVTVFQELRRFLQIVMKDRRRQSDRWRWPSLYGISVLLFIGLVTAMVNQMADASEVTPRLEILILTGMAWWFPALFIGAYILLIVAALAMKRYRPLIEAWTIRLHRPQGEWSHKRSAKLGEWLYLNALLGVSLKEALLVEAEEFPTFVCFLPYGPIDQLRERIHAGEDFDSAIRAIHTYRPLCEEWDKLEPEQPVARRLEACTVAVRNRVRFDWVRIYLEMATTVGVIFLWLALWAWAIAEFYLHFKMTSAGS